MECNRTEHSVTQNVTITYLHMWEGLRSIWLSGDGKREWYNKEFHEIHADAAVGKVPLGIPIINFEFFVNISSSFYPIVV